MTKPSAADGPLVLAIPSKGRLQESAAAFFARAGIQIVQNTGGRDYRGSVVGIPGVEVRYLSASEIAGQLAEGRVHLGITGEDLIRETLPEAERQIARLAPLGFGYANVVVAVPEAWIDVRDMHDLDEVAVEMRLRHRRRLRVATKYINLTRRFFSEKGVVDYRIVESLGATEGAPASGSAEIIVDITTTGATLAANSLKILDDGLILKSEANFFASLTAPWSARNRELVATILGRLSAEENARTGREVCAYFAAGADLAAALRAVEAGGEVVKAGAVGEGAEIVLHCRKADVFAVSATLSSLGARHVTVRTLDYVFGTGNPLAERLMRRLDGEAETAL